MKTLSAILVCAAVGGIPFGTTTLAQDKSAASTAQIDQATFVKMASSSNMLEIQSSELALERASSADVKDFASQMIKDHTKASNEMSAVLQKKSMGAPEELVPEHKKKLQQLTDQNTDFDASYVQLQKAAHEEAVGLFTSYSKNPDDADLGAFAQKTLPTLQMHLEHVNKLSGSD